MSTVDLLEWFLRAVGLLLAIALLYSAFFILPDEQEKVQNRLESWWDRMRDDVQYKARKFLLTFIQETAKAASRGFEWLFGELLSVRFFIVSGLLSASSFLLGMWFFGDYGWAVPTGLLLFAIGTALLALIGKGVSDDMEKFDNRRLQILNKYIDLLDDDEGPSAKYSYSRYGQNNPNHKLEYEKPWWQVGLDTISNEAPLYIYLAMFGSSGTLVFSEALEKGINGWVVGSAIFVSFVCDVIAIAATMYALGKIAKADNSLIASLWLLLDAAVAVTMALIPWLAFVQLGSGSSPFHTFLIFVAAANLSTALPAIAYVVVAATLLSHRALWHVFLRPCYIFFVHTKVLKNRKLQATSGIALLSISLPVVSERLSPYIKQILMFL